MMTAVATLVVQAVLVITAGVGLIITVIDLMRRDD